MQSRPRPFAGVEPSVDVEAARWLVERLHPLGQDVGAVVSEGFAAYVRMDYPGPGSAGSEHEGGVRVGDAEALAGVLAQFTATPQECWFCLWEGYGELTGAVAVFLTAGDVAGRPRLGGGLGDRPVIDLCRRPGCLGRCLGRRRSLHDLSHSPHRPDHSGLTTTPSPA